MAEGKYPEQMERERKEQLYMEAIGFFNEGKVGVHYIGDIILHHIAYSRHGSVVSDCVRN